MNFSRQTLLGVAMMLGGSVVLFAMVQQIDDKTTSQNHEPAQTQVQADAQSAGLTAEPLTADVETEQRILAQKQRERALRVAEQERRAQLFLAEQERAEAAALAKSRDENQQYVANAIEPVNDVDSPTTVIATPTVKQRENTATPVANSVDDSNISNNSNRVAQQNNKAQRQRDALALAKEQENARRREAEALAAQQKTQADKKSEAAQQVNTPPASPTDYVVQRGDGLIRLSRQYNVPVEALAQANNMSRNANLRVGQKITIPSKQQIARLEREAAEAERREEAARTAQQRLAEGRRKAAQGEVKGQFGVQVALADNQAKADEVAKKMRAAGYRVSTSQTSRGVRVIVGPETGKPAALALKDKINADPKTGVNNAWVLYWR